MYTPVWQKWGKRKTTRPLLSPEGSSGCLTLRCHLQYSPRKCCLLKRWTLYALPSWPCSIQSLHVRISGHTPPALVENLFPEENFCFPLKPLISACNSYLFQNRHGCKFQLRWSSLLPLLTCASQQFSSQEMGNSSGCRTLFYLQIQIQTDLIWIRKKASFQCHTSWRGFSPS